MKQGIGGQIYDAGKQKQSNKEEVMNGYKVKPRSAEKPRVFAAL